MNTQLHEPEALELLLSRTAEGDSGAFAELYERTSRRLFGFCMRMLRDRGAAEDVLQEVFVAVWRRAREFDSGRAAAMTWLITLTRNKAIDRLRQERARVPLAPVDFATFADERAGPSADAQASQEYGRLRRCLERLEPDDRQSIREAFFSGATYKELAERCQVPLGTMKSRIRRALAQLCTCLET
ncbi:MAG: sigma-70 family RNA polymerase sigma factor [Steroidobacteraceae bacterium]